MKSYSQRLLADYRAKKEADYKARALMYTLLSLFCIYTALWGLVSVPM